MSRSGLLVRALAACALLVSAVAPGARAATPPPAVTGASNATSVSSTAKPDSAVARAQVARAKAPTAGAVATKPDSTASRARTKATRAKAPDGGAAAEHASSNSAEDLTLKGGEEGTAFHSLTVEGEDRIHVEIERPELKIDLDPNTAPGLDWGSARDVLDRTTPDFSAPLLALSATQPAPYLGRPWLSEFATGPVARFQPAVEGVERWKLTVVDARGQSVASFTGNGNPPRTLTWDGRSTNGAPVSPGLTYSYVFEAYDRAGNKRNFVGQGFSVSAYRLESPQGMMLLFAARELGTWGTSGESSSGPQAGATPPIVLESASWLNQESSLTRTIQVTAKARNRAQADRLANLVAHALAPLVIGDPARIKPAAVLQADAPEDGTVSISTIP